LTIPDAAKFELSENIPDAEEPIEADRPGADAEYELANAFVSRNALIDGGCTNVDDTIAETLNVDEAISFRWALKAETDREDAVPTAGERINT
jgi:hypothetical protein